MPYYRMKGGFEVDENGYLREAVEEWAEHAIYPPPPIGDPKRPEVLAHVKKTYTELAKWAPEEQERWHERQIRFAEEFMTALTGLPAKVRLPLTAGASEREDEDAKP